MRSPSLFLGPAGPMSQNMLEGSAPGRHWPLGEPQITAALLLIGFLRLAVPRLLESRTLFGGRWLDGHHWLVPASHQ